MNNYAIQLDNFEGPLDLLLHLIKKHEMDIYDIPMTAITEQYLAILDAMKTINLDVAGEFLLMAATLLPEGSPKNLGQLQKQARKADGTRGKKPKKP